MMYYDIIDLVNELFLSGAEAVSPERAAVHQPDPDQRDWKRATPIR